MEDNFKDYVIQVKKVYSLLGVCEENDEAMIEMVRENSKLIELTEKYLKEFENVN